MMRLKVRRSGPDGKSVTYVTYDIDAAPGMTVLDALFEVQESQDDSLGFRYSCRGAICGSCAMTINREIRLACRTQLAGLAQAKPMNLRGFGALEARVEWERASEVLVEPLPNLPVQKDLMVDLTKFFEAYRRIRPWMDAREDGRGFSKMSPDDCARVEKYANCILCAACFGSCPVCDKDPEYLGPAALAWSYRFIGDPRVKDLKDRLGLASGREGAPDCEFVYNCVKACPKAVAPASAIRALRDLMEGRGSRLKGQDL
ncbi:MAG: hypothetical protein A3K67_05015 [Euryarchaeota archaeon RBG_16_62_10]|nr:MAG: hypothetical protein A3K67_05015 [Euryarchaeota archaeon RBG_16_62_10]